MMSRKNIVIIGVIIAVAALAWLTYQAMRPKANISLQMSPSVATARLENGKPVSPGAFYVTPGKHTITASFSGFADKTITFTATRTTQKLSILLVPNSSEGYAWLQNHPAEAGIRQTIGGSAFNNEIQNALKQNPIIAKLPFTGPGQEYQIDYGTSNSSNGQIVIYITYYTAAGKQDALNWITQQGYDPSTMNISYDDQTSQAQPINNPYTN